MKRYPSTQDPSQAPRIAFPGVAGAFSYEAARASFGPQAHLYPTPTGAQVCEALVTRAAHRGILPIANSQTGRMLDHERLLKQYPVVVTGTIDLPIQHCLLCLPGHTLRDILIVISHPQALAQCSHFLDTLPVQQTPTTNTAVSAQMIHEKQLKGFAAIASSSAAAIYHLDILAAGIQNTPTNTTRFLILQQGAPSARRRDELPAGWGNAPSSPP